ncbi:MAG: hypothetical protein WBF67_11320 [Olleya sp.]
MTNSIRLILVCIITLTQFSCKNDDDTNTIVEPHTIVGEWLRSDYTAEPRNEFKLIFHDNNEGSRIFLTTSGDGVVGTASDFDWNIEDNVLTITEIENETIITSFEFTSSGNLLLPEYSDLEFIRQ